MAAKKKSSVGGRKAANGTARTGQVNGRKLSPGNGASKALKGGARNGARGAARMESHANGTAIWNLRLYVAGQTPKSITAFSNLKRICEEHLAGRYKIEVVDLMENPHLAVNDQIVAVPTLVRKLPEPLKKVIGDLSNTEKALVGLDLRQTL